MKYLNQILSFAYDPAADTSGRPQFIWTGAETNNMLHQPADIPVQHLHTWPPFACCRPSVRIDECEHRLLRGQFVGAHYARAQGTQRDLSLVRNA